MKMVHQRNDIIKPLESGGRTFDLLQYVQHKDYNENVFHSLFARRLRDECLQLQLAVKHAIKNFFHESRL